MGAVHQLILSHGVEGARAMAATKVERHAVEAAAAMPRHHTRRVRDDLAATQAHRRGVVAPGGAPYDPSR